MLRSSTNKNLSKESTRSPAAPHKYFTRSKTKDEDEEDLGSLTASPHSSPSSRSHKIKYVMPAEQPMEQPSHHHQNLITTTSSSLLRKEEENSASDHITPMRARVIKRLELCGINVTNDESKDKKSWAQVLQEELNVSKRQEQPSSETKTTIKKKKKRNFKRVSILEEIYGKDIYLKHDDDEDEDEVVDSLNLIPKLNETNTTRPVPAIDKKVIGDLMSFNDDEEASNLIDLEDSRFMTLIKKSQEENNQAAHKLNTISEDKAPFQSTLLQTPGRDEYREKIDSLTPVLDTSNMYPAAPCRQFTKARTPYKQAMLDILYRTLAEARKQRQDNDDVLDCTMVTNADVTLISSEQNTKDDDVLGQPLLNIKGNDNVIAQPFLGVPSVNAEESNNNFHQPSSWLKVPNLTSPSMRAFPGKQDTERLQPTLFSESQPEETITKSLAELNLQQNRHPVLLKNRNDGLVGESKPAASKIFSNIPNLHSPSMRLFSASNEAVQSSQPIQQHLFANTGDSSSTLKQSNIPSESLFTVVNQVPNLHSPSMKMFPSSLTTVTSQKQLNTSSKVSFPQNGLQSTVTFAPPKHSPASLFTGLLRASSFTINHRQSPVVSSKVNPNPSVLSKLSSSSFGESFEFTPSSLFTNKVNPMQSSTSSFGSFGGSLEVKSSSLFMNEAPVFPAPTLFAGLAQHAKFNQIDQNKTSIAAMSEKQIFRSEPTSSHPLLLKPASFSLDKNKSSAFRPVKTTTDNVQPMDGEEVGLNTEIEVYTKIAQQHGIKHVPRCNDGTFNVVAKLLTFGDEQVRNNHLVYFRSTVYTQWNNF